MNDSLIVNLAQRAQNSLACGQLAEARSLYSELCELDNNNEEHWLTMSALNGELGDIEEALKCADKAIELDDSYVEAYLTKAHLLQRSGNLEEAYDCALVAVKRDDTYDEAMVFLTGLAGKLKRFDDAEHWANKTIDLMPDNINALINLGNAEYELNKYEEAEDTFKTVLKLSPSNQHAILGLARTSHVQEHYEETISLLEPLVADTSEKDVNISKNCYAEDLFATCLINLGREKEAFDILEKLIKQHPHFVGSYIHIAGILESRGDHIQAIRYLTEALENTDEPLEVLNEQARLCHEYGMHKQAIDNCKKALEIDPENETAHFFLTLALADMTRYEEALTELDKLLIIKPDNEKFLHAKANLLERIGFHDEAHDIVKSLINKTLKPDTYGIANVFARLCHRYDECNQALSLINNTLDIPELDTGIKRSLLFSLGRLHDRLHNYNAAFEAAKKANELKPYTYDHQNFVNYIDQITSPELTALAHIPHKLNTAHRIRPVFIVGMPRSGTSLVEQIISSHPLVIAGGERNEIPSLSTKLPFMEGIGGTYPECLKLVTPEIIEQILADYEKFTKTLPSGYSVLTDKMPENFNNIIFIRMLFPDARIIHCVRNPLDTCLSLYFQQFAGYHGYAYDLKNLGIHYNEYKRLMNYYRDVAKISFLEIQYEDLVQNTEEVSRKMIDYCNLEWDDQCLRYYESDQIIRTASYEQANQPIYTSSIEKWKNYESHLQPLRDSLHLPE